MAKRRVVALDASMIQGAYNRVVACIAPEGYAEAATRYRQFLDGINYQALDYCLRQYIWAELDHKTSGIRGLGRTSTDIPRLAAYYRQQVGLFNAQDQAVLYYAIQDVILSSFMTYVLFAATPILPRTYATDDELYRRWLPLIYSSVGRPKPGMLDALDATTEGDCQHMLQFMQEHRMQVDKTTEKILYYYCAAGLNLSYVETI